MNPLVSVIIPAYMQENYIQETIDSILDQTFQDFEIIVVDDGSADGTGEKVLEYKDPRITYHYQKNSGRPACSRNKGISLAKGEYLAFVDGDDIFLPEKLEKQIDCFKKNPKLGFVFTNAIAFNEKGDLGVMRKKNLPSGMIFNDLFIRPFTVASTTMTTRKCLEDVGVYDESWDLKAIEDYDLDLRIAYKYPVYYIHEPLAKYRYRMDSLSGTEMEEVLRIKRCANIIAKKLHVPFHIIILQQIKVNVAIIRVIIKKMLSIVSFNKLNYFLFRRF